MNNYTLKQRSNFYRDKFPDWPAPRTDDRWLDGMWILGQDYRGSGYYGSYPPNYMDRVMSMFPDAKNVLHLFSGSLPKSSKYTTFDIKRDSVVDPDCKGNAENLQDYFNKGRFDLILADPPYSEQDAERYGTCMVKRKKVFESCNKVLIKGGHLVWLDQIMPMYKKIEMHLWGVIGILRSTNHRFRVVSFFECMI